MIKRQILVPLFSPKTVMEAALTFLCVEVGGHEKWGRKEVGKKTWAISSLSSRQTVSNYKWCLIEKIRSGKVGMIINIYCDNNSIIIDNLVNNFLDILFAQTNLASCGWGVRNKIPLGPEQFSLTYKLHSIMSTLNSMGGRKIFELRNFELDRFH